MGTRWVLAIGVAAAALACGADAPSPPGVAPPATTRASQPDPPLFHTELDAGSPDVAPHDAPVDAAFDARLRRELRGVVRDAYADYDWTSMLGAKVPWSGVLVWVPGTGESVTVMGSVPSGLDAYMPWRGWACSQSEGGAEFKKTNRLSALEVFTTAWPDANALVSSLGAKLHGAWIVGHSAGALPALLAGLLAGAHRVDAYGVPSAVGALDGDDGLVHLHTHPLDPAGSMGSLDANGDAQIDLLGAFATTIRAGGTLAYHDYSAWPAPSP